MMTNEAPRTGTATTGALLVLEDGSIYEGTRYGLHRHDRLPGDAD